MRTVVHPPAHLVQRTFRNDPPAIDHHDLPGQRLDLVQHVAGDQDGYAFSRQPPKELRQFVTSHRVGPGERLVQHQQFRPVHQRLRHLDALAHTFRVRADRPARVPGRAGLFERFVDGLPPLRATQSGHLRQRGHELPPGQVVPERIALRAVGRCATGRPAGSTAARRKRECAPRLGFNCPVARPHQRALAGPVRTDQSGDAPRRPRRSRR